MLSPEVENFGVVLQLIFGKLIWSWTEETFLGSCLGLAVAELSCLGGEWWVDTWAESFLERVDSDGP